MRRHYDLGRYSSRYTSDVSYLMTPTNFVASSASRCIIGCHGHGGTGFQYGQVPLEAHSRALIDAGYVVLGIDHARINSWGDPDAMRALDDAYTFVTTTLGMTNTKIGLQGWSMGGTTSLNWLKRNTSKVAGAWLWNPASDLRFFRDASGSYTPTYSTTGTTQGSYTSEINTTFAPTNTTTGTATIPASGGSGVTVTFTAFSANNVFADANNSGSVGLPVATHVGTGLTFTYTGKTDTTLTGCVSTTASSISVTAGSTITGAYAGQSLSYNPWNEAAYIGGLGVPIKVVQASDDTTVPSGMNAQATTGFVARASNANVTLRSPQPTGGHIFGIQGVPSSEVVAFYDGLSW